MGGGTCAATHRAHARWVALRSTHPTGRGLCNQCSRGSYSARCQPHRHGLEAIDQIGTDAARRRGQLNTGIALEELLEKHPRLQPCQVGTEAQVNTIAECQMWIFTAVDIELLRIREHG